MKKIIHKLLEQPEARNPKEYRVLNRVKVKNYYLSIQGSTSHYCAPREDLPVDYYTRMEIAIINKKGSMLSINRSSLFRKFPRYNELVERADGLNGKATVYGYVPVDLINDLYLFLLNN
jgi:hypothetical protein